MEALKRIGGAVASVLRRLPAKRVDVALAVLVTAAGLVVFAFVGIGGNTKAGFGFVQNVELKTLDMRFQLRGPRPHDDRIVIVGIDEKTLQKLGAYPIPRSGYAQAVDAMKAGGARVVGFDVAFPTPEKNSAVEALERLAAEVKGTAPATVIEKIRAIQKTSDNDVILADALKRADNVVLGHLFLDEEASQGLDAAATEDYFNILWGRPFPQMIKSPENATFDLQQAWLSAGGSVVSSVYSNMRLLAESARSYGFYDNNPDNDGTMRRGLLLVRYADRDFYPSLAFQTVREYDRIKDQSIVGYMAENGLERLELGPYRFKTNHDGTVMINFAGPYKTYQHYSLADVIDGTVPPETFRDKIVLLGATAKGIGDLRSTPFGKQDTGYMGVEIHANIIDNMLHNGDKGRSFLTRGFTEEMLDLAFILAFGLGLGYWFGKAKPLYATLGVVAAMGLFGAVIYLAFAQLGMWLSFVIPAGTLVLNYASITSFRMIFEEREKRKLRKSFGTYVSPGVIALMEKDPKKYSKAGGESKELTVMFSDIRNFTNMSEGMTPDELVFFLNEYLGEMTEILFRRWGTLDKYIGDALMGFWGSPFPQDDHAIRACACALDMSRRLDELNMKWELEGKKPIGVGIGLNTGMVNVGNMGSSKRLSWTVMGDNVNLASRLEGLTKNYHSRIVIAEGTYRYAKDHFVVRPLDKIRVKGKLQPVNIYEVLDDGKEAPKWANQLGMYNDALNAYRQMRFEEAVMKFQALLQKYPHDGAAEVMLQRSQHFLQSAPVPEWDGVYVFTSK